MNVERLYELCWQGATAIYFPHKTKTIFINRIACLMLGTAAQESNLVWERQRSVSYASDAGGFSKWQVERGIIQDCLEYCKRNKIFADLATQWVFHDPNMVSSEWVFWPISTILWALRMDDNDKLGFLFARFKYLTDPQPIPASIIDQAKMWKRVYNTALGAGTVEQYLSNWDTYCAKVTGISSTGGCD